MNSSNDKISSFIVIVRKLLFNFIAVSLTVVCLYSLYAIITMAEYLNIDRVMLKEGVFDIVGKTHEFIFDNLGSKEYNVMMECFHPSPQDERYSSFTSNVFWKGINLSADIELLDSHNAVLKKEMMVPGSQHRILVEGFTSESFALIIFKFDAKRGENYSLRIAFREGDEIINKLFKKIYIIKNFDSASVPGVGLFLVIFIIVFLVSSLILLKIVLNWRRKKRINVN